MLEWIRAHAGSPPVVVLTSSVNPGDMVRALDLGAKAFHTKPADLEELLDIVRDMVERWID